MRSVYPFQFPSVGVLYREKQPVIPRITFRFSPEYFYVKRLMECKRCVERPRIKYVSTTNNKTKSFVENLCYFSYTLLSQYIPSSFYSLKW